MQTSVSDAGLVHLYDVKSLTSITLLATKTTEEGRQALAKALPKAGITPFPKK
jgi:hypothetical protein